MKKFKSLRTRNGKDPEELPSSARKWIKARKVLKPSLFITAIILSSVVYYINEISISNVYQGIQFPLENRHFIFDADEPANSSLNIPYLIQNNGFFELSDIKISIFFRFEYRIKDQSVIKEVIVFSKEFEVENIRVRSFVNGSLYSDFHDFHWNNVYQMLNEYDQFIPINIYFDIHIRFTVIGFEKDQISITNLLVSNEPTSVSSAEKIAVDYSTLHKFHTIRTASEHVSTTHNFIILMVTSLIISAFIFIKKNKKYEKPQVDLKRRKKILNQRNKSNNYMITARLVIYIIVIILFIVMLLYNIGSFDQQNQRFGELFIKRHELVTYISIATITTILIIRVMPLIKKEIFYKNSVNESLITLIITSTLLVSIIFWAMNSALVYRTDENTVIIRNTFAMYIPIIAVYFLDVVFNVLNTLHFQVYKAYYKKMRDKEKRKFIILRNKKEFDIAVFKAIKEIGSSGSPPSLSQIKSYFGKNKISTISRSKNRLNLAHLDTLVEHRYLQRSEKKSHNTTYYVYYLTPKAEIPFAEKNNKYYETNEKAFEVAVEEFEDDEQLIPCPVCDYYCQKEWETCPLCGAIIFTIPSESTIPKEKKELIFLYCISCGKVLNNNSNGDGCLCDICGARVKIKHKFTFCPYCGKKSFQHLKFCTSCYRSFYISSHRLFKNYSKEDLYKESLKSIRNSRLLILSLVQTFLLVLLLGEIMRNVFLIDFVIEIYDFLYVSVFFMLLLLMNRIKYYYLKKERLKTDASYKDLLTLIYAKRDKVDQISVQTFRLYDDLFTSEKKEIKNILHKIGIVNKLRAAVYVIIIIVTTVSIYNFISNNIVITTLSLWMSIIFLLYYVFNGKKTRYINEMFRLGVNYTKEDYKEYVKYVMKHLEYI